MSGTKERAPKRPYVRPQIAFTRRVEALGGICNSLAGGFGTPACLKASTGCAVAFE
jgi:hypothetical protein